LAIHLFFLSILPLISELADLAQAGWWGVEYCSQAARDGRGMRGDAAAVSRKAPHHAQLVSNGKVLSRQQFGHSRSEQYSQ
jgi:hypothetical protein